MRVNREKYFEILKEYGKLYSIIERFYQESEVKFVFEICKVVRFYKFWSETRVSFVAVAIQHLC